MINKTLNKLKSLVSFLKPVLDTTSILHTIAVSLTLFSLGVLIISLKGSVWVAGVFIVQSFLFLFYSVSVAKGYYEKYKTNKE